MESTTLLASRPLTVGVAIGARGSDTALEQAEVVLMNDRLENFVLARTLSIRSRRIIYENIAIALGAVVFMIWTASLFPILLALGMAVHEGSTVVVVLNSLRLLLAQSAGAHQRADDFLPL